jgi:hypothetical protein
MTPWVSDPHSVGRNDARNREPAVHDRFTLQSAIILVMPSLLARAALVCLVVSALPGPAAGGDDHRGLRQALARDEIVSFKTILDWIEQRYVGRIVEVELEDDDGELIYEVDLLSPQGDLIEFEFDARSGEMLDIDGHDPEAARRP